MRPNISVVVPTFQRPELLERCLGHLLKQSLAAEDYEIIVADDEASLRTKQLVAEIASQTPISLRYVPVLGKHGPAAARNAGARAAALESRIVAFTDDDCIPDRDWLKAALAVLSPYVDGSGPLCASGQLVMPLPMKPSDYELDASRLAEARFVTANAFVRKDAFWAVGGFDERFSAAWREDSDLFFRLLRHGDELGLSLAQVKIPTAIVEHPIRQAPWGISLRQQRKNFFNALLYKKHPVMYRHQVQARPPWSYYASVAALALVASAAFSSSLWTAGLGFLVWLALTARFCVRRLVQTKKTPSHLIEMAVTSALIPPLAVYWRLRGAITYRVFFL